MAGDDDRITAKQQALIENAPMCFVASTHPELEPGPTGQGAVHVTVIDGVQWHAIDDRHVAYLD
jgi:hypothetical protein